MQGGEDGVRVGGGFGWDVCERVEFGGGGFGFLCVVAGEAFEEAGEYGVFFGVFQLGGWGEGAEFGVGGEVFDEGGGFVGWGVAAQGEAGNLEAVEEQAGAAWVEVVGGDALENLAEGELDAGAVVDVVCGEVEGAEASLARCRVFDGAAGGVVVVAEGFVAEAGRAAAVAVGEDVAALVAGGGVGFGGEEGLAHSGSLAAETLPVVWG